MIEEGRKEKKSKARRCGQVELQELAATQPKKKKGGAAK
jgi:hypothetical protein